MEEIVLVEDVLATVAPAVTAAPTVAEKAVYGLGVAALGMITVFAGLIILIVFITLLGKITSKGSKKKNESKSGEVMSVYKIIMIFGNNIVSSKYAVQINVGGISLDVINYS